MKKKFPFYFLYCAAMIVLIVVVIVFNVKKPEVPENPPTTPETSQPESPGTSEGTNPEEPSEPTLPDQPTEPSQPIEPEEPNEPENPVVPEPPVNPIEPEQPSEPDKPIEPSEPDTPIEPSEPEEIYATNLTLNCATYIVLTVNEQVKLLDGYITIEPVEALDKLTAGIYDENLNFSTGITFNNNLILANRLGKYYIKFSIPTSAEQTITKMITIDVVANDAEDLINQNIFSLTVGDNKSITEIFTFSPSVTNYSYVFDDKMSLNNNVLTAKEVGESDLTVTYIAGMVEYVYKNTITIKALPVYEFLIKDNLGNVISDFNFDVLVDDDPIFFNVYIKNGAEEYVPQELTLDCDNTGLSAKYQTPFLKVSFKKAGTYTLTVVFDTDISISKTFTFVIT